MTLLDKHRRLQSSQLTDRPNIPGEIPARADPGGRQLSSGALWLFAEQGADRTRQRIDQERTEQYGGRVYSDHYQYQNHQQDKIGRASCRERVEISVVSVS